MRALFIAAALAAIVNSASGFGPAPNSYGMVLVRTEAGDAAAKISRRDVREDPHIFTTVDALKEFCARLPSGATLEYVYPMAKYLPSGSERFLNSLDQLKIFCASRGVDFHVRYPDW